MVQSVLTRQIIHLLPSLAVIIKLACKTHTTEARRGILEVHSMELGSRCPVGESP
jgi:hypothetical protein